MIVPGERFPFFLRFKRLWTVILRAQVPVGAVERLRHLLVLAHKSEYKSVEIRVLYDKAIGCDTFQYDSAIRMHEHEFVAFSCEFELLVVK